MKNPPPRIATWLLQRFGPWYFAEALAGDLLEDFAQQRSPTRYWKEVLSAIAVAQAERIRGGIFNLLQGLLASWTLLVIGLWAADGLAHRWMLRSPGRFYPRIVALTSGQVQWTELAHWTWWLALVFAAHAVAGAALAWVPRQYRRMTVVALIVSLLDWKMPLIGGFMRHLLVSRPEEGFTSNMVELLAALLGVVAGAWLGSKAVNLIGPRAATQKS